MVIATTTKLYFASGETLEVVETTAVILGLTETAASRRWGGVMVTKTNGDKAWVSIGYIERVEPK